MFIKWSNLHKSVSKFTPKKFYVIDPRAEFSARSVCVTKWSSLQLKTRPKQLLCYANDLFQAAAK
jgi:hypothetical protein